MNLDSSLPRMPRYAYKAFRVLSLRLANRLTKIPVTGEAPITVSITSFGDRLSIVAHAIESIAQGTIRPHRFILWVDDDNFDVRRYPMLGRLVSRGLEIRRTKNYGPHNKSYPFAQLTLGAEGPLATADDDFMYPREWLSRLLQGYNEYAGCFVGFRGHHIEFDSQGSLRPYAKWSEATPDLPPSFSNFLTGVAGVVFSPAHLKEIGTLGEKFMEVCPRADDIWINVVANRLGLPGKVLPSDGIFCLPYPKSQRSGLYMSNVENEQNDIQLAKTLSREDLEKLRAE